MGLCGWNIIKQVKWKTWSSGIVGSNKALIQCWAKKVVECYANGSIYVHFKAYKPYFGQVYGYYRWTCTYMYVYITQTCIICVCTYIIWCACTCLYSETSSWWWLTLGGKLNWE